MPPSAYTRPPTRACGMTKGMLAEAAMRARRACGPAAKSALSHQASSPVCASVAGTSRREREARTPSQQSPQTRSMSASVLTRPSRGCARPRGERKASGERPSRAARPAKSTSGRPATNAAALSAPELTPTTWGNASPASCRALRMPAL